MMAERADEAPLLADLDDFAAWLAGRTGRYEFLDGRTAAMASGSELHNDIQVNLLAALKRQLRGGPCKPNGPDLLVRTDAAGRRGRFPDASITCGRESGRYVTRPVVLFAILSPETELVDRTEKRRECQMIPSVAHYVLIGQEVRRVEIYSRDGASWRFREVESDAEPLRLDPPGIELTLAELYDGLDEAVPAAVAP
jgi:Uma2 family endonuclease